MEVFRFLGLFASTYLILQIFVFIVLIAMYSMRIKAEKSAMKEIKKAISKIDRKPGESPIEIERQLNILFKKQKESKYKMLWNRYYERSLKKESDERMNVEPFFGFDVMNHHLGKRAVMDIGSGLHVSLGVLGTFIGLSFGLMELQVGDTERLREGIGNLLDGMKTAFYTSVLGVILSIVWTVLDKVLGSKMDEEVDWHSEKLNYLLSTDDEEIFLSRMEKISKNQADHLKTLLADALENVIQPIVSTIQQSNGTVAGAIENLSSQLQTEMSNQTNVVETQTRNLVTAQNHAFKEVLKYNSKKMQSLNNEVTTAINGLSTQIEKGTSNQAILIENQSIALQESISPVITTIEQSNESIFEAFNKLIDQMQLRQTEQPGAMELQEKTMKQAIEAIIQQFNEVMIHTFSDFTNQLYIKFDNQSELMKKQTDIIQAAIFPMATATEQASGEITNILKQIERLMQTEPEVKEKLLEFQEETFKQALTPIASVMEESSQTITNVLEKLSNHFFDLKTDINDQLKTIGAQAEVTATKQTIGEITNILGKIENCMQANPELQEKLLKSQGETFKQVVMPIALAMENSNKTITTALEKLSAHFFDLKGDINKQLTRMETQAEVTKNTSEDASEKFIAQVTGETKQSLTQFTDILHQSQKFQSEMANMVQQLALRLTEAELKQEATTEKTESILTSFTNVASEMNQIKNSYLEAGGFMNDLGSLFQTIQAITAEQLPIQQEMMKSNYMLSHKYDDLIEGLQQFQSQAEEQYGRLLDQAADASSSMIQSFETMTAVFQESLHTQKETISHSERLLEGVQESAKELVPIAKEFRQAVQYVDVLGEQLQNMQTIQAGLLPELVKFREETNEVAIQALGKTESYIENMTEQLNIMEKNWETTKEQFQETTQALHLSMKDFESNIEGGLSKTYHYLDESLTMAVNKTSGLIYHFSDMQKEFIEQFEDATEALVKWKAESVV